MPENSRVLVKVDKCIRRASLERQQTGSGKLITFDGNVQQLCPYRQFYKSVKELTCLTCREDHCAEMATLGLDLSGEPLPIEQRPACDAKLKSGQRCAMRVIPGKRRCRAHGGLSTGPKSKAGRGRISYAQKKRWEEFRSVMDEILPPPDKKSSSQLVVSEINESHENKPRRKKWRRSRRISPMAL